MGGMFLLSAGTSIRNAMKRCEELRKEFRKKFGYWCSRINDDQFIYSEDEQRNQKKITINKVHILLPSSLFNFLRFFFLYKLCAIHSRWFLSCLSVFMLYTPSPQRLIVRVSSSTRIHT
jgi:hypothetical protein